MDYKTLYGNLGELSVLKKLAQEGLEVYTCFSGKGSFNIIAYEPQLNLFLRIAVISCTQESNTSYIGEIKRVRSNRSENVIHGFDKEAQDIVALYIVKEDTVVFLGSNKITTKSQVTILKTDLIKYSSVTALNSII